MRAADYADELPGASPEYTAEEISAYYLELEQVLQRIEKSTNHYQVLDLDRLATTGEIKLAYLRAVALLNPSQLGIQLEVPEVMLDRIDPAFERVSRAYSTLVNFARRMEYDGSLSSNGTSPLTSRKQRRRNSREVTSPLAMAAFKPMPARASQTRNANSAPVARSEPIQSIPRLGADENRRRCERFRLSVPVHITGYDKKGGRWHEATRTVDVSRTGALVQMRRRVKKGTVLYLTMPLPVRLRTRDFQEPTYVSYALVRRVEAPNGHVSAVGLEFLGVQPPTGYLERPWDTFKPEQWAGNDRRRTAREDRSEAVLVEYFNETMQCIKQETAATENVGRGGLRVVVKAAPADFVAIRINSVARSFTSFASVCDRFTGKDGRERLCLRLLESEWPL
jgi:curved DNA-binding protein CbpA